MNERFVALHRDKFSTSFWAVNSVSATFINACSILWLFVFCVLASSRGRIPSYCVKGIVVRFLSALFCHSEPKTGLIRFQSKICACLRPKLKCLISLLSSPFCNERYANCKLFFKILIDDWYLQ